MASDETHADRDDAGTVTAARHDRDRPGERRSGERREADARTRPVGPDDGPDSPTDLPGSGWKAALQADGPGVPGRQPDRLGRRADLLRGAVDLPRACWC